MTLLYVPLEGYASRYTMQWAAPKTGWLERNWTRAGIEYTRIDGDMQGTRDIKVGSVVDGVGRSMHCFSQISKLLLMAEKGQIKDTDVIFFDDFWTPGFEALPYAFHLLGIRPRMYAFLHAQSVDEFDFTYGMRSWMRPIEKGMGEALDGIFVCCPTLKDLVAFGGIADRSKIHVTGHPFSSEEVMERMPEWYRNYMNSGTYPAVGIPQNRHNTVIWSSRWDNEKNPIFFLRVAEQVIKKNSDVRFVICTSAPKLRSNQEVNLQSLDTMVRRYPCNIIVEEGLTKEEYYAELCSAKIQFNHASQDFVAITLLESSVAGCYPIYPYFRSFPETFLHQPGYMSNFLDLEGTARMILEVISRDDLWTREEITKRAWIHNRFDTAWLRMLQKMGVANYTKSLVEGGYNIRQEEYQAAAVDPFSH